ncbi:MAG: nucleotidyl transferase AbiEii/AbiGii toxin family protein [Thermoleophilia bacterium]|nr:nucleotidyl transferase AbiEii/AbiGii toxin family protein [Thermoleophilia bacterium]
MESRSNAQIIEHFHVVFLDILAKRLSPTRYVLKGGANLRYFFASLRYSEDIDLDVSGVAPWGLESKIDDLLESVAMRALLRVGDLELVDVSKPKQTETTRRWKLGIAVPGRSQAVRTKIEFSNRNGDDRFHFEPVPSRIVAPYGLRSPSVQHYTADAATEQKVEALTGRTETQTRDVFDLDLLLRRNPLSPGALDSELLGAAAELALQLPFAAFRDQVLPFLEPGVVELYATEAAWEQMQTFVAGKLEEAR